VMKKIYWLLPERAKPAWVTSCIEACRKWLVHWGILVPPE
jgi:hypothetical protein